MLFMVAGYLKEGAEAQLIKFHEEFNQQLSQPFMTLTAAGVLRDESGKRRGYMAFMEAGSIEEARQFIERSPYYREHLYERIEVFEYQLEVGEFAE
jgi:uncharacterized protein YciI